MVILIRRRRPTRHHNTPALECLEGRALLASGPGTVVAQSLTPTYTDLTAQTGTIAVGDTEVFTATVRPTLGVVGNPTGNVVFTIDGQVYGLTPLQKTDVGVAAVFSTSGLPAGLHAVTAAYRGDASFAPSNSGVVEIAVVGPSLERSTTSVTVATNPVGAGQPLVFTATVAPSAGVSGVPTGSVIFTVDGQPKGQIPLQKANGKNIATLSIPGLPLGNHTVNAAYTGDAVFGSSTSAIATFLVQSLNPLATTTTVVATPQTVSASKPLSFTATVTHVNSSTLAPTGNVIFTIDGVAQPGVPLKALASNNAQAILTTSTLPAGVHTVTAYYPGDPMFTSSTSTAITAVVGSTAESTVRLSVAATTAAPTAGQPITFLALVSPVLATGIIPSGTVTLVVDGRTAAAAALSPSGTRATAVAVFTIRLPAGLHRVALSYGGDLHYLPANTLRSPRAVNVRRATVRIKNVP